jgi:adenosylmethionine-8-amino-7-oxononanoate aminotransferase
MLAALDQKYVWHPFTQMKDWLQTESIVIVRAQGANLWDAKGRRYLDANSSIWTNLHGHGNARINSAIKRQLGKVAHSSALGLANEPASLLAERLIRAANGRKKPIAGGEGLSKVFFSDDGSTAMEVALKLSYEYWRRNGVANPRFLSLQGAYHGDTVGAVSLGHIDLFHKAYGGLLFGTDSVMAPYCYRCPFNRAKPERTDARTYRKCNWECTREVERKFVDANKQGRRITGFVVEPLMQGAAGMIPQPDGWLTRVAQIAKAYRAHLIADEIMTAFGRALLPDKKSSPLFATQKEQVMPDFLALAKGLTGGYLPLAATLTSQAVFDAFLGEYEQFKTFFHGHSYSANQLGCAAALASLDLLQSPESKAARRKLAAEMAAGLQELWQLSRVGDIRQVGSIAGIELVRDWRTREPFDLRERAGIRVCEAMAKRGVLTRPIGNVIVLMPPYCTTARQLGGMIQAMQEAIEETFGP